MKAVFAAALATPLFAYAAHAEHSGRHMHVTKNAGCGCCSAWVDIAKQYGFDVTVEENSDYAGYKRKYGVPFEVAACHSARIGGYVIEGHVPMNAIEKLLKERPEVHGISVPGMPFGSPGMGTDPDARYDVVTFRKNDPDSAKVFVKIGADDE